MLPTIVSFIVAQGSASTAEYNVFRQGNPVGTASLTQKLTAAGKVTQFKLEIKSAGTTATIRQTSTWDMNGVPVRKTLEMLTDSPRRRVMKTISFKGRAANIIEEIDAQRTVSEVIAPGAESVNAVAEYWFLRDMPKKDARSRYLAFDTDRNLWETTDAIYLGPKSVKVGEKTFKGFMVRTLTARRTVEAVFDDKGIPMLIEEENGTRFERVLKKGSL
jgi:hypothetical protein